MTDASNDRAKLLAEFKARPDFMRQQIRKLDRLATPQEVDRYLAACVQWLESGQDRSPVLSPHEVIDKVVAEARKAPYPWENDFPELLEAIALWESQMQTAPFNRRIAQAILSFWQTLTEAERQAVKPGNYRPPAKQGPSQYDKLYLSDWFWDQFEHEIRALGKQRKTDPLELALRSVRDALCRVHAKGNRLAAMLVALTMQRLRPGQKGICDGRVSTKP